MAGVSTKEIKNRIRSMESTKQITKAMEMVAASKLRHAQARVMDSRPYFEILHQTISDIVNANSEFASPYLQKRPVKKSAYIVIAGDRGLAGGYNSNILKLAESEFAKKDVIVLPIGKKSVDYYRSHNVPMITDQYDASAEIEVGECFSLAKQLCRMYLSGEIDEIYIGYTNFVSVLTQTPTILQMLPLTGHESGRKMSQSDVLYEPDSDQVFGAIVPEFVGGMIYGALCESHAAEHAARRTAMDAATQNANEMIADLSLKFNQARQAAITQEITEIVAGS